MSDYYDKNGNRMYDKDGNRLAPYAEDSTRGKSLLQPLNYKGDVLVQVWIDSRILATLTSWMEIEGIRPRAMSEVVREPLMMLVEKLVQAKAVDMIDDTLEARGMLSNRFRTNLNRGGRGGKNVLHNQILSDMRREMYEPGLRGPARPGTDAARPVADGELIPLEDYGPINGVVIKYKKGDTEMRDHLIAQLKAGGIKSFTEQKEEMIEQARKEGRIANEPGTGN